MQDCFKRNIDYLRVSLTNKCNLRCLYCMPANGCKVNEECLTKEQLIKLISLISSTGITKIRLTGGEPLLYPHLNELIVKIKNIIGIKKVVLTTNGILLADKIKSLQDSGLDEINISLDCIDKNLFYKITRGGNIDKVYEGIKKAKHLRIPVKLNSVILQGINQQEVIPLVKFAQKNDLLLRFIELMPMNVAKNYQAVNEDTIKNIIEKKYGKFYLKTANNEPARYYQVENLVREIGFISALSHGFCVNCNRIRLTFSGFLKPCLHYDIGADLKSLLIANKTDKEILSVIKQTIYNKPQKHHLEDRYFTKKEDRSMSLIGG